MTESTDDYVYRFQYADKSAFQVYEDGRAFIVFPDGRKEEKFGVIDNRIRLLVGASAKPRQDRIDALVKALVAAEAAYKALMGRAGYSEYQALEDEATRLRTAALGLVGGSR
jgi:hypothetical protein